MAVLYNICMEYSNVVNIVVITIALNPKCYYCSRDGHAHGKYSRWPTIIYTFKREEPSTDKPTRDCTKQVSPHTILTLSLTVRLASYIVCISNAKKLKKFHTG